MTTQRITLRDVAEAANVSLTAVSFYLNNREGISDATRTRIADAIERLGYIPRSPTPKVVKSTFVGLLIERLPLSPFVDMFYGEVIQGIELQARSLGYNISLMTVEGSTSYPQIFEQHNGSLAGLVILGIGESSSRIIESVHSQQLPAVLVDMDSRDSGLPSVMPDYVRGAYEATRYLLSKGYRRIAFIQGSTKYHSLLERFHGYICALVDAGIPVDPALVQPSISSGIPNKGYLEMKALIERSVDFDAVFGVTDLTAFGVLDALRESHILVPNDLALVSFDNISQSSHTTPPLTTVEVYKRELGTTAIDILHRQITASHQHNALKILSPKLLIVRAYA
jgi:LacI family transcriptional regulator